MMTPAQVSSWKSLLSDYSTELSHSLILCVHRENFWRPKINGSVFRGHPWSQNEEIKTIKSKLTWLKAAHFTVNKGSLPSCCCLLCSVGWTATHSSSLSHTNERFDLLHWSEPCLHYAKASPTGCIKYVNKECSISNACQHFRILYVNIDDYLIGH